MIHTNPRAQVRIASFVPSLRVIESKQRPRKLSMRGSDGVEYSFLLKGKEDLRQDERVMQVPCVMGFCFRFSLSNIVTLCTKTRECIKLISVKC
jgi:phosphatidylinositol kinase/protein kinase (PI-3  family)